MMYQTVQETLTQLGNAIGQLDNAEYQMMLPLLSDNSVGKHTRHILEFYECLLNTQDQIVDYDTRQRNLLLEISIEEAQAIIQLILTKLKSQDLDSQLFLRINFHQTVLVPTSYSREIAYQIEHTIHHLAIIKIAIQQHFPHVYLPENFGVAYSTIHYQQKVAKN